MGRITDILTGPVNDSRGAPMGRYAWREASGEANAPRWFYLRRVPIDSGGYDPGGAYWGHGQPLYGAFSDESTMRDEYGPIELAPVRFYMRADTRDDAKRAVLAEYPGARFFDGAPQGKGA